MSTTLPTFHAHGQDWYPHTPGDAMPCDGKTRIHIILRKEVLHCENLGALKVPYDADYWNWHRDSKEHPSGDIIGWRYAEPPQDELPAAIQSLTSTPGISAESRALIEAALAVQTGKMSLTEALGLLTPSKP